MGNKRTCGIIVPSSCVPWTGGVLLSFDIKPLCDPVVEEVILELDKVLGEIKKSLDVTKISPDCYVVPTSKQWYDVASNIYHELCVLKQQIQALQPNAVDVGSMPITVNLECMAGACNVMPVPVSQLFELILHRMCAMEARLDVIDPSNNTSGDTLFQPA
jgi:hypothetical protein